MTLNEIRQRIALRPGVYLTGLSGGGDSLCLFHVLRSMPEIALRAVHVNHGLRGAEADADEFFVRQVCEQARVPLLVYRAEPPDGRAGEDWARQVRYDFFAKAMRETGADALVLAHQRDDQAETFLERLLRGTGLDGLCGMEKERTVNGIRILRPLLSFSGEELRSALRSAGYVWRDDATNAEPDYLRNAIRLELLPAMERISPGAGARIAATAEGLAPDRNHLQWETEKFLRDCAGEDWLMLEPLKSLSPGLRARVLRRWWERLVGKDRAEKALSRPQTERFCSLIDRTPGATENLPGDVRAVRGRRHLHLVREDTTSEKAERTAMITGPVTCLGACELVIAAGKEDPGDGMLSQEVPESLLEGCVLRNRRPGDMIRPFGMKGHQSLQDYLINRHVDEPFRDRIPLLCRENEVLLVCGVGAGALPLWRRDGSFVRLNWRGEIPWCPAWRRESAGVGDPAG